MNIYIYINIYIFIMSLGRAHISTAKPRRVLIANHQRFETTSSGSVFEPKKS